MVEQCKDQSQNERQQGTGGRVQTRLERDLAKRQLETREQLESRVQTRWERDCVKTLNRGNKRPEQWESRPRVQTRQDRDSVKRQQETSEQRESRAQTRRERAGLLLPLSSGLIVWRGNETSKQGNARLQSRQIAWSWEANENYS